MSDRARSDPGLLQVRELVVERRRTSFWGRAPRRVVDRVSFQLPQGEILGLVGESGAGKTSLAHAVLGLIPFQGSVLFDGIDVGAARGARRLALASRLQLVLQDPARSLDPRDRVGRIVGEGPSLHERLRGPALRRRVEETLDLVGIPASVADRHPHQCSGGQRQRIALARALALRPQLLICDEPVSALDVSVQARILRLLQELRERLDLALLFISHDLRVVGALCERILVLQHGRLVEEGPVREVLAHPQHAHTQALLASLPGTRTRTH